MCQQVSGSVLFAMRRSEQYHLNLIDAIYTRQSVDRADSISVESQAEFCKREVVDADIKIYTDKGYSGKNTDRPAFQEMLADIEAGRFAGHCLPPGPDQPLCIGLRQYY